MYNIYFIYIFTFRGPNDKRFGPRFFPANEVYSPATIQKAKQVTNPIIVTSKQAGKDFVYILLKEWVARESM